MAKKGFLPFSYERFKKEFPEIEKEYEKLAIQCHASGPLPEKTRRLIKLGIAIGSESEGAVKSHTRRALSLGISPKEIRHVVLLQAVEKRPYAAFPSSFVVATYIQVRLTPQDFGRLASGHF
jgi:4-carboxymuconolactone decarboxylase